MSAFRAIDVAGFERPAKRDLGAKPTLQWIAIADLVVDETYQRRISAEGLRAVRRIASEFDWSFFSPCIVAPIEGRKFAIIDGQHRTTAAAVVGITSVPCLLVLADPRQQAAAFAAINGRVQRASTMQIYHAAKAAGEPWAVSVSEVADAAGVTILRYPMAATLPERPRHSTMSAKTIEQLVTRYGRDHTILTLRCISNMVLDDAPAVRKRFADADVLSLLLCKMDEWIRVGNASNNNNDNANNGDVCHDSETLQLMRSIAWALFDRPALLTREAALFTFFDDLDAGAGVAASITDQGFGGSSSGRLVAWLGAQLDRAFPDKEAAA